MKEKRKVRRACICAIEDEDDDDDSSSLTLQIKFYTTLYNKRQCLQ